MGLLTNLLTKNKTNTPLIIVTFDYKKFKELGKYGSCISRMHPLIQNDEHVKRELNKLIDYIRDRYDMNLIP